MNAEERERVIRYVDALVDLPPDRRAAAVAVLCADPADAAVRAEVERALAGDEKLDGRLADLGARTSFRPADPDAVTSVPAANGDGNGDGGAPTVVGRYHVRKRIGAGGMGEVYLAEQLTPIRREVAVKLIRAGFDSHEVVARFDAERQSLALMDHPHIATVLDAGSTDGGRPYFVMELVHGVPITTYCDDRRLPLGPRLLLFAQVCRAVQHAHGKGVVHRDLKPSNVLVAEVDGRPEPKVIDFGIAQAVATSTAAGPPEWVARVAERRLIGTPAYMSPEQADPGGGDDDVDTRSDVYSLGVLLYELLTGATPFDANGPRPGSTAEVRKVIREADPPTPSTWLGKRSGRRSAVANGGPPVPLVLARSVRGDLDWVVMRCLAKDRGERYATAEALARDVERYLAHEPVEAGPDTARYRMQKFARRHRRGLATAAAFGALLAAGAAASAWQAVRATAARDDARRDRDAAEVARAEGDLARAQAEAARAQAEAAFRLSEAQRRSAEAVTDHLVDALSVPDMSQSAVQSTMANTLRRAAARIDTEFVGDDLVKARLFEALGLTCGGAGIADQAVAAHDKAREIRARRLGVNHPDTLRSMANLAAAQRDLKDYAPAAALFERTVALQTATLGADHEDTLRSSFGLARTYLEAGRHDDAMRAHEAALKLQTARLGDTHPDTLRSTFGLARTYWTSGRMSTARPMFESVAAAALNELGPLHPDARQAASRLASAYQQLGRHADAEPLVRSQLDPKPVETAETAPGYANALERLGLNLLAQGKFAAAEVPLRESLALRRKWQPTDASRFVAEALVGRSLAGQGDDAAAEPLLTTGFRGMRDRGGNLPWAALPRAREARVGLVRLYERRGDDAAAERYRRDPIGPLLAERTALAELAVRSNPKSANAHRDLGKVYVRAGAFAPAEAQYAKSIPLHQDQIFGWHNRALLLAYAGDEKAYAAHCKSMTARFADAADGTILDRVARACLTLPGGADPAAMAALADRSRELAGGHELLRASADLTRALAAYRGGDLKAAADAARASRPADVPVAAARQIAAELVEAMALKRSGDADGATAAFDRARRRIDDELPVAGVDDLIEVDLEDWLLCQTLRREAEALFGGTPTTGRSGATRATTVRGRRRGRRRAQPAAGEPGR